MATDVYLYWIQYGNIEIRVKASDAVGSSYGIVILIVKLSRQNGWEQKNHLKPNPKAQTDAGIEVWTMEETEQKEFIPDRTLLQGWTPEQEKFGPKTGTGETYDYVWLWRKWMLQNGKENKMIHPRQNVATRMIVQFVCKSTTLWLLMNLPG